MEVTGPAPVQRRGAVVVLAPDEEAGAATATPLRDLAPCRIFTDVHKCAQHLAAEDRKLQAQCAEHERIVDEWRTRGTPLVPQILQHWALQAGSAPAGLLLVDTETAQHAAEILPRLHQWSGSRLLVSREPADPVAAEPLANRLVDEHLHKSAVDYLTRLRERVLDACCSAPRRMQQAWASTLEADQLALLGSPDVAQDLQFYCRLNFRESILVGHPFGIVGITRSETLAFVQLAPVSRLEAMASTASGLGWGSATCADIRAGRVLLDADLEQSMGHDASRASPAEAFSLGSSGTLLAAVRRLL